MSNIAHMSVFGWCYLMLSRSYVQAGAGGVSGVFLIDTFTKNVRPSARTLGPALAPPPLGF